MRTTVGNGVHGTIPPVDGAVVERQLRQLRGLAAIQRRLGILVLTQRQQRREVPQILLEQVENRGNPPLAEPHPRPDALLLEFLRPGIGDLLEERDPSLAPELTPEEERGVRRQRDLDAGDRLGGVPVVSECLGADLKVKLGARAGGFRHDRVHVREQPFRPVDADPHVLAASGDHLVVEQLISRVSRHRRGRDVALADRGQDADHDEPGAGAARTVGRAGELAQHAGFQRAQRVTGELLRWHIDLEVEPAEFGCPGRVGDGLQHLGAGHGRQTGLVDQVQLHLQPHVVRLGIEPGFAQHPGKDVKALADFLAVCPPVLLADDHGRDIPAH